MSNLRSDAREFAETLKVGTLERTYIERLAYQVDEVEELWHGEAKTAAALRSRVERYEARLLEIAETAGRWGYNAAERADGVLREEEKG